MPKFGEGIVKPSRGRRGKWKDKDAFGKSADSEPLVIPEGPLPKGVESKYSVKKRGSSLPENKDLTKPKQEIATEKESSSEEVTVTVSEIPSELLEVASGLLRGKPDKNWTNTPGPILKALKAAGFDVRVVSAGTPEKPGDMLELSQKHNGNDYTLGKRSTKEVAVILQGIIEHQEAGRFLKAKEANTTQQSSEQASPTPVEPVEEGEPQADKLQSDADGGEDDVPVLTDVVEEIILPTIPETQDGDPEDVDDGIPVLTDVVEEIVPPATPERLSDEALRERAEKIAKMRAEILGREEEGVLDEGVPDIVKTETEVPQENKIDDEKPKEGVLSAPERPRTFDARFESEFGVTKEMWEKIPGHEKLSEVQQKLVLQNLLEFNSRDKFPHFAHVWEGIKSQFVGPKATSETMKILTQLVSSTAESQLKVHEENGELFPDFVGLSIPHSNERKKIKDVFDVLNHTAHTLAKTPASWREDGIGTHSEDESKVMSFIKNKFSPARKRYVEYTKIQDTYERAKKDLCRVMTEQGFEPSKIAQRLVEIDKNVYELQFQQTSPDAVEAIKNIPDPSMWAGIGKSIFSRSTAIHMGLGFVGRTALAGVMGVFAAPVTSALSAGSRAWSRSAAEMRERDRAARMGKRDTSGEALNIIPAELTIDVGGGIVREVGATQRLNRLIAEYEKLNKEQEDIEGPPSREHIKKMNILLDKIRVRATYVEDKQRLNRINFGKKDAYGDQMAKLYEALATARMILADNEDFSKDEQEWRKSKNIEERLSKTERLVAQMLAKNENTIQNKRRSRQVKEVSWHALRAGAFSYAGGEIARHMNLEGVIEKKYFGEPDTVEANASSLNSDAAPYADGDVPEKPLYEVMETPEYTPVEPNLSALANDVEKIPHSYTIQSGDTLTKILKEQVPEIKALGTGQAQENALANIFRGLTPEELERIGLSSGKPNLIYPGETINMDELHKIIDSRQSIIDRAVERFGGGTDVIQQPSSIPVGDTSSAPQSPAVENASPLTGESGAPSDGAKADASFEPQSPESLNTPADTKKPYEYNSPMLRGYEAKIREEIFNGARTEQNYVKWHELNPTIGPMEAESAGIIDGHFKHLFGEKWKLVQAKSVADILMNGPGVGIEDPGRTVSELRALVETVAKPPMNVKPLSGEGIESFLNRACEAYALDGPTLPEDNLIRKIEAYYQPKGNVI